MTPRKKHPLVILGVIATLAATVLLGLFVFVYIPRYVSRTMSDFSALWNTTDALLHYVATTQKWPSNWDELNSSFAYVDPTYSTGDLSFAQERVEINFDVNIASAPRSSDWYVRLKSESMKPEQTNANQRLRALIERVRRE